MKAPKPSGGMQLDEALKILNVTKETPREEMINVQLSNLLCGYLLLRVLEIPNGV